MFEQPPKKTADLSRPLKAFGLSCAGLLLAIGFCGLDQHLYPNSEFGGSALALIGAGLGAVSAFVLIGSGLAIVVGIAARAFKK